MGMPRKPCTVCGITTKSAYALCPDHNPHKRRRVVTDTEAWCNKGQHMVEHAGFAKNQETCRECRRQHYNDRSNFSQGKTCRVCGVRVANTNIAGRCRPCHQARLREEWSKRHRTYTNVHGYVVVRSQWAHPNANKRGHLLEHVQVMSEMLGRALLPGENVHHINGVRDDNRPENLELWVRSQPSGQRPDDLVAWAWQIIERYGSAGTSRDDRGAA